MKKSRSGRRRAYVLGAVHVLMIAHFLHWMWSGSTLTPVEPSESMETIRNGAINMGFLFFAAAILSTLVLGRWVCGWGCHLIAYQDLTLWLLKKAHLRPKAFRTRFLFLVTTIVFAAGWMFLLPLAARIWGAVHGHPQPGFELHLARTGYWDTFPGPVFSVLSVLIAGMGIVYFLGPKGFCTFACPYGAVFGAVDRFAASRIRVTEDCNQCGHCTASCTSNVRVAEEVNLFKMVVDPGCMKCLDCVEVCPNDALYVGFGLPAVGARSAGARKPTRYDLTLVEEIVALALFFLVLVTVNGLYGEFPYLLSLAIAGILTYCFMKGARALYTPDSTIQKIRLKVNGRLQRAGVVTLVLLGGLGLATAHSAVWRYHDLFAGWAFADSPAQFYNWQYDSNFAQRVDPAEVAEARRSAAHYEAMQRWGLVDVAVHRVRLAWLLLFLDRPEDAAEQMRRATALHPDVAVFWLWRAKISTARSDFADAAASYDQALALERLDREALTKKVPTARHTLSAEIWSEWGRFLLHRGDVVAAGEALENAVRFDPTLFVAQLALVDYDIFADRIDEARRAAISALRHGMEGPEFFERLERIRVAERNPSIAVEDYQKACAEFPDNIVLIGNLASALAETGRIDDAIAECRRGLTRTPDSAGLHATLGALRLTQGDVPAAIREYESVHRLLPGNADAMLRLALLYANSGRAPEAEKLLEQVKVIGSQDEKETAHRMLNELRNPSGPKT